MERNGHPLLTDAATIQRIFARTGCECFAERDTVLRTIAILHQGTNFRLRLASDGRNEAAIRKTADGTLKTVRGDLLQDCTRDECVNCVIVGIPPTG
jgi:hypothetical protein